MKNWPASKVKMRKTAELTPYANNSRVHSPQQVDQIAASINEWGWTMPVLADEKGMLIAGHGRIMAAQKLGIEEVPTMTATGWTEAQKKAYVIADNQLALVSEWDEELLGIELQGLREIDFDLDLLGFGEIDLDGLLDEDTESSEVEDAGIDYKETFAVVVTCDNESHQQDVYESLLEQGYTCKVLVN